jgi:hypothetical protein
MDDTPLSFLSRRRERRQISEHLRGSGVSRRLTGQHLMRHSTLYVPGRLGLSDLLPALDVWLDVPLSQIQDVVHILPTLEWKGGLLGVRLKFELASDSDLKGEYLLHRKAAALVCQTAAAEPGAIDVWPKCLTDYLDRKLRHHLELNAYCLDPDALALPIKGLATPQILAPTALPLEKNPFRNLIKIDEIAAQRDFADAGGRPSDGSDETDGAPRRFKRRLSDQLRTYYDRHLDPAKTPSAEDYDALRAIQEAERNFDKRLERGFLAAFEELEDLGYPGVNNPKLKITTQLRAIDGLRHGSAVQYQVYTPTSIQPRDDAQRTLVQRQQPLLLRRDRDAVVGVEMDDVVGVLARGVNRRVDDEAGIVDAVGAGLDQVAIQIDLDQAGGGDLAEPQPIRIDQEVVLRTRHARRDVGEDQVVPALQRRQTIERGQIDANAPLVFADLVPDGFDTGNKTVRHLRPPPFDGGHLARS